MTFWDRIEKALKENNLTEAELSRRIGYSQAGINGWKSKQSLPRVDIALKTAKVLNTNIDYLVNGTLDTKDLKTSNLYLVPELNSLSEVEREEEIINSIISLPYSITKQYGKNLIVLTIQGDSMQPTLYDSDLVVCDTLGWDKTDGLFAVKINGQGYIKRIQVGNEKLYLMSDNSNYKSFEISLDNDNINIIGKVRLIIHSV